MQKKKRIIASLLATMLGVGCQTQVTKQAKLLLDRENASYAIYTLILRQEFAAYGSPFFIERKTTTELVMKENSLPYWFHYQSLLVPVADETIGNYFQVNETESTLERKFEDSLAYNLNG